MTETAIDLTRPRGLPDDGRGAVVTVGTFDGVHRGHRAVLEEIRARAADTDRRAVLLTFHPHPLRIVRPQVAPRLLTTPVEKMEILAETGLDYAVFLRFTAALSQYPPQEIRRGDSGWQARRARARDRPRPRVWEGAFG